MSVCLGALWQRVVWLLPVTKSRKSELWKAAFPLRACTASEMPGEELGEFGRVCSTNVNGLSDVHGRMLWMRFA